MKYGMFFLPLIFASITSCIKDSTPVNHSSASVPSIVNKTVLLQLVNDSRKKGCNCGNTYYAPAAPLTWSDQLEKAAFNHSMDMFENKYFSHVGSDGSNSSERIISTGYNCKWYGENIAQGYPSEKEVVAGWLSSPGHCANIMNKNFKEMGVARASDYWTQDFGSR
jgi:uncharacterized protein YkwD